MMAREGGGEHDRGALCCLAVGVLYELECLRACAVVRAVGGWGHQTANTQHGAHQDTPRGGRGGKQHQADVGLQRPTQGT